MAIITTPKGWAIEFAPVSAHKTPTAKDLADDYAMTLKSVMTTIQVAQSNKDFLESPDYYTMVLLENMLPDYNNAVAMFEALLNEK